jgi:ABC-type multidrug transport system ATPase subunit
MYFTTEYKKILMIIVNNLSKIFCAKKEVKSVFSQVSFKIEPGEILALRGPNGAGKTTLLKVLSTLTLPTTGSANVFGYDILEYGEQARGHSGLAYESEKGFYQFLKAAENLRFFGMIFGMSGKLLNNRITELSEELDFSKYLDISFHHCSSGIKQRLCLAKAVLHTPVFLMIDEPTKSLDTASKAAIRSFIKRYVKENHAACIAVTHDPDEPFELSAKTAILADGRLEATA